MGLGFAADAYGPSGSIPIQQSEAAVRASGVELRVQGSDALEKLFHFRYEWKRAERLGAGHLSQVHRQVIPAGRQVRVSSDHMATDTNALGGDGGALGVVGGEFGPIERGPGELPGRNGVFRRTLLGDPGLLELPGGKAGEGGV